MYSEVFDIKCLSEIVYKGNARNVSISCWGYTIQIYSTACWINSAPTQCLELYKKEHLRFQRTNQMLHKSNARVYKLKNCVNQTLWVESALVAQCRVPLVHISASKKGKRKYVCAGPIKIKRILFVFSNFITESEYDWVQIEDENGTNLLRRTWGSSPPGTIINNVEHHSRQVPHWRLQTEEWLENGVDLNWLNSEHRAADFSPMFDVVWH